MALSTLRPSPGFKVNVGSPTTSSSSACAGPCGSNASYRDLSALVSELGVRVAPSTILRWVVRYALDFEQCWQPFERPVGDSWRCDETYLNVNGEWAYLYRAVDKRGKTVESYLSRTRDITAAKAFFREAFKRHGEPGG